MFFKPPSPRPVETASDLLKTQIQSLVGSGCLSNNELEQLILWVNKNYLIHTQPLQQAIFERQLNPYGQGEMERLSQQRDEMMKKYQQYYPAMDKYR